VDGADEGWSEGQKGRRDGGWCQRGGKVGKRHGGQGRMIEQRVAERNGTSPMLQMMGKVPPRVEAGAC
jgi:hypothetical protein